MKWLTLTLAKIVTFAYPFALGFYATKEWVYGSVPGSSNDLYQYICAGLALAALCWAIPLVTDAVVSIGRSVVGALATAGGSAAATTANTAKTLTNKIAQTVSDNTK